MPRILKKSLAFSKKSLAAIAALPQWPVLVKIMVFVDNLEFNAAVFARYGVKLKCINNIDPYLLPEFKKKYIV
jgi:hypothetical protein